MANILEFLRGVLTDAEIRGAFQSDPTGFLQRTGFGDLTGEDVAEAVAVVRRSLPPDAAAALSAFEEDDDFSASPWPGERELDAAARVLLYAIGQVPLRRPTPPPVPPVGAPAPAPAAAPTPPPPPPPPKPEPKPEARPTASPPAAPSSSVPDSAAITAFGETMTTILGETKARLTDVLRQAAQDAERIRADAEADVAKLRADAASDRDAAREYLERTRTESDAALARSQEIIEDAERQRTELLASTQAENDASRREIDARRAELRDAERQLKERLGGIDALFRTVLRDDEDDAPAPTSPS